MSDFNYGVFKYESDEELSRGILIAAGFYPWKAIIEMTPTSRLGRTLEVAREYRKHLNMIEEEWDSTNSFCLHTFLECPIATKSVDGKEVKYVPEDSICQGKQLVLRTNTFPYALQKEIKHLVLWSRDEVSNARCEYIARKRFPADKYEISLFVNPCQRKSITRPHHIQVFVCPKGRASLI